MTFWLYVVKHMTLRDSFCYRTPHCHYRETVIWALSVSIYSTRIVTLIKARWFFSFRLKSVQKAFLFFLSLTVFLMKLYLASCYTLLSSLSRFPIYNIMLYTHFKTRRITNDSLFALCFSSRAQAWGSGQVNAIHVVYLLHVTNMLYLIKI